MAEVTIIPRLAATYRQKSLGEPLATGAVWLAALLVVVTMAFIIGDMMWSGASRLSWTFLTAAPAKAGRAGGIGPILVSTVILLLICLAAVVPLGVATAMLLAEFTRKDNTFARLVRLSLDILAGVPSIVFGLFGNAFFSIYLGLGFSLLSGGLTLACMVLPLFIRATEEGFRSVPEDYRKAAAALSVSRAATVWHILLPAAAPGVVVGLVLGIGRALAETAALLFTSGYVDRMPQSLLDSGRALSIHIFDLAMNVPGGNGNAYASCLVLVALLIIINGLASWITNWSLRRNLVEA